MRPTNRLQQSSFLQTLEPLKRADLIGLLWNRLGDKLNVLLADINGVSQKGEPGLSAFCLAFVPQCFRHENFQPPLDTDVLCVRRRISRSFLAT